MNQKSSVKSSRWTIYFILVIPLATFLAATIAQRFVHFVPEHTKNIGQLIKPVTQIDSLGGHLQSSAWQLWVLIDGNCDSTCLRRLAIVRDAHWALGKESHRVIRKAIIIDDAQPFDSRAIEADFTKLELVTIPKRVFTAWQASVKSVVNDEFHLGVVGVDPLGNAFIYYDRQKTGNNILIDFRGLLKFSSIG